MRLDDPRLSDAVFAATGRSPTGLVPLAGGPYGNAVAAIVGRYL